MRTRLFTMVAALLLISAGAKAQDTPTTTGAGSTPRDIGFVNQIDFGVRGTMFDSGSDQARFQRFRDLRDGAFLDRFRYFKDTASYKLTAEADHLGYDDQRLSGSYNNFGSLKASFEWNQTPLFYSDSTQTLYNLANPGALTLDRGLQAGIQGKTVNLVDAIRGANVFDVRSRRDVADFKMTYSANRDVDFNITLKNTNRNGTQPYGAGFGFSDAIEVPLPVDHRTTEFGANLEWSNGTGFARVGYDGSFFRNNITTFTWDNPQRVSDSATAGPVTGRMALWPNTDQNSVNATGGLKLPGHSHASAYLSVGTLSNNDPLIPLTINTAIAPIPLERQTAEAKARVTAMNYNFTSNPTNILWFNARYRQYDFNNQTQPFFVGQTVNYDTSVAALNADNEPYGYTRHTFDGDMSVAPYKYAAFRVGYTHEQVDRTFRVVEATKEDVVKASIDSAGIGWLTLRGVYEHSKRTGSGVDVAELIAIGEQPSLRQFDIGDRNRDRFSAILQVMPTSVFSVNASAGIGREDYPGANFGLRNNDNNVYSVGFDYVPTDAVSMGLSYGYEKYTALQASRTANPLAAGATVDTPGQDFNDPRRDWTDNSADKVHTVNGSLDLTKVFPKTDIKFAYDYSKATSTYVYGLAANTVLVAPVQLPAVTNELQRGTIDGRYFVTTHLAIGLVYWFDKYAVNDFALGPQSSLALPATASPTLMALGYYYRPYTANTVMGRFTYLW